MIKMKNNFLLCEESPDAVNQNSSGFTTVNTERFKTVTIIHSQDEDVPVGCQVKISVNAGEEDELGLVIRITDIIYVL